MPRVTILMPVHNAAPYLAQAIGSVLSQTFRDLEVLVLDDASTDGTVAAIEAIRDARLRLIRNPSNLGVALTLNRGLDLARGDYIARMDADDVSHPRRIERQVRFMDGHPETGLLGTGVRLFGAGPKGVVRVPVGAACVRASLLFDNPVQHPTAMLRRSVLGAHALRYNPVYSRSEDYDLWIRMADFCEIDNLAAPLLRFRMHPASVTQSHGGQMKEQTALLLRGMLKRLGLEPSAEDLELHQRVGHGDRLPSRAAVCQAEAWLLGLGARNRATKAFDPAGMDRALEFVWFRVCAHSTHLGLWVLRRYRASSLAAPGRLDRRAFGLAVASAVWHTLTRREPSGGPV